MLTLAFIVLRITKVIKSSLKREIHHEKSVHQNDRQKPTVCLQCHRKLEDEKTDEQSSTFDYSLQAHYPNSMLIEDFVFKTKELLVPKGFYPNVNTMCCIGLCRDEITCQFKNIIESMYGAGFSCGSLAGLLFCGRTGFLAAHHHVPADSACLIYYCFTHIAISEKGEIGVVLRSKTGMKQKSTACGALMAFTNTLSEGIQLPIEIDENDVEMSCLKKHVLETVPTLSTNSTLLDVTHAAYLTITRDLEYHVLQDSKCYQKRKYALFTGIQIHGPNGHDSVWLGKSSIVQNGTLVDLPFHETNKYQT